MPSPSYHVFINRNDFLDFEGFARVMAYNDHATYEEFKELCVKGGGCPLVTKAPIVFEYDLNTKLLYWFMLDRKDCVS
jgi:hypothetical protein